MIFESEFVFLTILVFSLTAAVWLHTHGFSFSLAELTTIQNNLHQPMRRPAKTPILLPSAIPLCTPTPVKAETPAANTPAANSQAANSQSAIIAAGSIPLDQNAQLNRVSQILQSAIELADKAERLHNAAHEQLDGAHYALQNLLDELSTVMPVTSPAKAHTDVSAGPAQAHRRQTYVTALAA